MMKRWSYQLICAYSSCFHFAAAIFSIKFNLKEKKTLNCLIALRPTESFVIFTADNILYLSTKSLFNRYNLVRIFLEPGESKIGLYFRKRNVGFRSASANTFAKLPRTDNSDLK